MPAPRTTVHALTIRSSKSIRQTVNNWILGKRYMKKDHFLTSPLSQAETAENCSHGKVGAIPPQEVEKEYGVYTQVTAIYLQRASVWPSALF